MFIHIIIWWFSYQLGNHFIFTLIPPRDFKEDWLMTKPGTGSIKIASVPPSDTTAIWSTVVFSSEESLKSCYTHVSAETMPCRPTYLRSVPGEYCITCFLFSPHLLEACLSTQRGFQFWSLSCFWSHRSYYYSQFLCLYRWFGRVKSWRWGQLQMEIFVLLISAFGDIVWNLFIGMCILLAPGEIF